MVAPDVQIEDGKGTILISSEEGETEGKEEGAKLHFTMKVLMGHARVLTRLRKYKRNGKNMSNAKKERTICGLERMTSEVILHLDRRGRCGGICQLVLS